MLGINKIPLINPENPIKIMINSIIVGFNFIYLFYMTVEIFFHATFGGYEYKINQIANIAWMTEMILEMNTATYHKSKFITDRKHII